MLTVGKLLAPGVLLHHVIAQPVPAHKLHPAHRAHQGGAFVVRHLGVDLERVQVGVALAAVLARVPKVALVHPLDVDAQHVVARQDFAALGWKFMSCGHCQELCQQTS